MVDSLIYKHSKIKHKTTKVPKSATFFLANSHMCDSSIAFQPTQGRQTNQCHRAMALGFICLASKTCFESLPQNYDTLKYLAKKPGRLEVELVDFSLIWRP